MADSTTRAGVFSAQELLRQLPSVDELLKLPRLMALAEKSDRTLVVDTARNVLQELRKRLASNEVVRPESLEAAQIEARVVAIVDEFLAPSLQPVINATGVILHTNLGRAPLATATADAIRATATGYSNLEYDLASGQRGKRDVHVARLLRRLTTAVDAIVVNNCAAGLLVTLAALARGGEVLVSRGELIEIGDGFRIPEIMEQSAATLREVGTTNRTRIADYENAITEKTRVLLRVHPSNFRITGFTDKPEAAELIALGKRYNLPVIEDLGSGLLADLSSLGIAEPTVGASVVEGFSLVLFSGDKLLGGPQAGIIAGEKDAVAKVRRHPLFRALRVDKLILAALEATLRAYLQSDWNAIPAQHMIRASLKELEQRAGKFVASVQAALQPGDAQLVLLNGPSVIGGGSTPTAELPSRLIRVASHRYSAVQLEQRMRRPAAGTPVICRIADDGLLVDLRTVFPEQEATLSAALIAALR